MKTIFRFFGLAAMVAASGACVSGQTANDAVLVRLDDDIQQVRVEAYDTATSEWLAIASGYREAADTGWLKIALPDGYAAAQLRVLGSAAVSPFAGKISTSYAPDEVFVDYPPAGNRDYLTLAEAGGTPDKGGAEPVIEEADIWAWEGATLYFYNQYRGLQVIDMADPTQPQWLDYFRYPAKGEDLYAVGDGRVILIGTGNYWGGDKVSLKFLKFSAGELALTGTVDLEAGQYLDSRRYNDFLYVMTREWVQEVMPDNRVSQSPLIRLYTVDLRDGVEDRLVDVKSYHSDGWLDAVLTAQPDGILLSLNRWYYVTGDSRYRWHSEVHVLAPGGDGVPVELGVAKLSGVVQDKFKMNFRNGLLTTVSQQSDWATGQFSRATRLENFALQEGGGFVKTGSLDFAPGESLFASRFYGDTVYIVTFLFVDPLFAIDNSNPSRPVIAGELEVPGWSNYIEWVDDQLFAVGIENSKLTVSIFDVADPANMSLKSRVFLGEDSWAWSEAQYDDQAISIFPEARMLMLPFTTWSWNSQEMVQAMQLISWDDTGLQLRGRITHLDVPRRGVLFDDTVVTISGRQVVTTDVTDPDAPLAGGTATLAWNVTHLIPHADYWLQLEASSDTYGYWYWRYPYADATGADPVLYVTSKAEPNVPEAEIPLASGRLVGVAHQGGRLVLLQDVTAIAAGSYQLPEKQSLAVRVYDLADPLVPALIGEKLLEDVAYLGSAFTAHLLPDGAILWASKYSPYYGIYMYDMAIWPGPWYYQTSLSYLVAKISDSGTVEVPAHAAFPVQDFWNQSSGWFWQPPLLLSSMTTYVQHDRPEKWPYYEASSRLLAIDFSDPAQPVKLPGTKIPGNLAAVGALPDGLNYHLYFEPQWNAVEVWGWDGATAFELFRQHLYPDDTTTGYSYSLGWMLPFHLRNRYYYDNGSSSSHLDVWLHEVGENRFSRINSFAFDNLWFGSKAVQEPYFLQATNDSILVFKGDAAAGSFELAEEVPMAYTNIYTLDLEKAVIGEDALYVPAGIYGVETLPWAPVAAAGAAPAGFAMAMASPQATAWQQLDAGRWMRVDKASGATAGVIEQMQWLYWADSTAVPDPSAADAGDRWRHSEWFGWYAHDVQRPECIRHLEHGMLALHMGDAPETAGFFIYDARIGFLWTHEAVYPFMYCFANDEWLHYAEGTGMEGNRWFYGFREGWQGYIK